MKRLDYLKQLAGSQIIYHNDARGIMLVDSKIHETMQHVINEIISKIENANNLTELKESLDVRGTK